MNTIEELDIITRMRGEVMSHQDVTGENLFLAWGYPTVIVLLAEFAALMIWNEDWCVWLWAGIPLIGTPLMIYFLNKDYARTHSRTHEQNSILVMWIFIGFASCLGGWLMGFTGVFRQAFFAYLSLLCGMGCFMTGIILHFRPKTICGILASLFWPPCSLPYPSSFKTTCGLGSCWSLPSLLPFHSSFRDICSVVMSETKDSCNNNNNVD